MKSLTTYLAGRRARKAMTAPFKLSAYGRSRLSLHFTGPGVSGIPAIQRETVTGLMLIEARDTLNRLYKLAEKKDVNTSCITR